MHDKIIYCLKTGKNCCIIGGELRGGICEGTKPRSVGGLFSPTSLGVPPSPQRAAQSAHKQGRFEPGVLAPQAKRSKKSSHRPRLLVAAMSGRATLHRYIGGRYKEGTEVRMMGEGCWSIILCNSMV